MPSDREFREANRRLSKKLRYAAELLIEMLVESLMKPPETEKKER